MISVHHLTDFIVPLQKISVNIIFNFTKMRKITILSMAAMSALVLTSCSKLGALTADDVTVTPTPLEAIGGEVPATISATFPQKYMKKKATVTVIPVLKFEGGEVASAGSTFQGEKVQGNGTTVSYKAGGNYTMRANFPYQDAMLKSDLYLRFDARMGNKTVELPDLKVGYGVVATGELARYTVAGAAPAFSEDAYQRIIKQKQEAQIKYLVNQANVRASELKSTSVQDFTKILREINDNQEKLRLQNIEVSAYASPEGRYDFNEQLAEKRQNSSAAYVNEQLKKNKMSADVDTKFTAEDWDGFQQLVSESNIQDKDVILRVLSMYKDPAEREAQIRNMSIVYDELAKGILPELRRARLIANYDVIGRSDEQIQSQFAADPSQLSIEELLYGAKQQDTNLEKQQWYEKAAQLYPSDARPFNNLANLFYQAGDLATANNYLQKAKNLNPNNPEVATNEALVALAQGNIAGAETSLAKGAGSSAYKEVLGNINLFKGNYAAAASNLSESNTNSAALASILNKDYARAKTVLSNIQNPDAMTYYLGAILAARINEPSTLTQNLKKAIQLQPSLATRAAHDLEFAQYAAQVASAL